MVVNKTPCSTFAAGSFVYTGEKDYSSTSTTGASGAFLITDAMPLSLVLAVAYIWLDPITWPLVALRLNWNSPFFLVEITNFPISVYFLCYVFILLYMHCRLRW